MCNRENFSNSTLLIVDNYQSHHNIMTYIFLIIDVTGLTTEASNFLKQSQDDILTALRTYISAKDTPGMSGVSVTLRYDTKRKVGESHY